MGDFGSSRSFEESQAMDVSAKVMVAAIIVLFLVIVFVLLLHLYAKWSWNRRAAAEGTTLSSRHRRRRFVFTPSQDPVVTNMYRGLEPSVIKSLPILTFNPDDFKDGSLECAVCLSELSHGEKARLLPKCNHGFHVECIDMWFQSHSTCPLCRNPIAVESSNSIPESSPPQVQPLELNSTTNGFSIETPNFPTNVLFWGNQTQVSTRGTSSLEGEEEQEPTSTPLSSSSSTPNTRPDGDLVIEVPQRMMEGFSSISPSTSRFAEEDLKSPMTTRLRSLRRLLSREKKFVPCSPNSIDLEQGEGGRGQSSKIASESRSCYTNSSITTSSDRMEEMST